jgi:hypothetical protein
MAGRPEPVTNLGRARPVGKSPPRDHWLFSWPAFFGVGKTTGRGCRSPGVALRHLGLRRSPSHPRSRARAAAPKLQEEGESGRNEATAEINRKGEKTQTRGVIIVGNLRPRGAGGDQKFIARGGTS